MQSPMSSPGELKRGAFMSLDVDREIDTAIQLRSAQLQLGEFARVVKASVVSPAKRPVVVSRLARLRIGRSMSKSKSSAGVNRTAFPEAEVFRNRGVFDDQ